MTPSVPDETADGQAELLAQLRDLVPSAFLSTGNLTGMRCSECLVSTARSSLLSPSAGLASSEHARMRASRRKQRSLLIGGATGVNGGVNE